MLWFFWSLRACSSRRLLRRAHARCVIHSVFSIVMKQQVSVQFLVDRAQAHRRSAEVKFTRRR